MILVEDLITDGGSKLSFINALEEKKGKLRAIFVIFNYGIFFNKFQHKNKSIKLIHLTTWKDVVQMAFSMNKITLKEKKIINDFLKEIGVKN